MMKCLCTTDYGNGQLINKLPGIEFMVLKSTRARINTEIADVAKALHGEKTAFLRIICSHIR
jgi:hypothetical protein